MEDTSKFMFNYTYRETRGRRSVIQNGKMMIEAKDLEDAKKVFHQIVPGHIDIISIREKRNEVR